jgi:hypothetical protein
MPQEIKQEGIGESFSCLNVTQQDAVGMHTHGFNRTLDSDIQRSCHNVQVQNGDPQTPDS